MLKHSKLHKPHRYPLLPSTPHYFVRLCFAGLTAIPRNAAQPHVNPTIYKLCATNVRQHNPQMRQRNSLQQRLTWLYATAVPSPRGVWWA